MRTIITLIFGMTAIACLAQEQPKPEATPTRRAAEELAVPIRRIVPEEIEKDSVRIYQFSTNNFAVRWTYTEAGAKAMLAFNEAHQGKKTRLVIGELQLLPPGELVSSTSTASTNYVQWKEGWMKYRTDKVVGVSEADARKIVDGLQRK
jgi:hypothetical protein